VCFFLVFSLETAFYVVYLNPKINKIEISKGFQAYSK
jgi:hypothetical protein